MWSLSIYSTPNLTPWSTLVLSRRWARVLMLRKTTKRISLSFDLAASICQQYWNMRKHFKLDCVLPSCYFAQSFSWANNTSSCRRYSPCDKLAPSGCSIRRYIPLTTAIPVSKSTGTTSASSCRSCAVITLRFYHHVAAMSRLLSSGFGACLMSVFTVIHCTVLPWS